MCRKCNCSPAWVRTRNYVLIAGKSELVIDIIGTVESSPKGGMTLAHSRKPVVMPQNIPQYLARDDVVIHQSMNKVAEEKMPKPAMRQRQQPGRTNGNLSPRTRTTTVQFFLIMRCQPGVEVGRQLDQQSQQYRTWSYEKVHIPLEFFYFHEANIVSGRIGRRGCHRDSSGRKKAASCRDAFAQV